MTTMMNEKHRQFLLERAGAGNIRHSGRTLYEHLCGTYHLLDDWGNDEPVCTAGLFHSIYGTRRFKSKAWPIDDRTTIKRLIGDEAEALVYYFCVSDRPKVLFGPSVLMPSLREIEAANLIEQGSRSRWLKHLRDSDISDAAKSEIDKYLREAVC